MASNSWGAITVFILDDHELVRRGLKELLEEEGFSVIGESASAQQAIRQIPALHPDVSILDARLLDGNGIEVCRDIRSVDPSLNCLILTSYDDDQALQGAILAGASGYVLKEIRGSELLAAIRRVSRGEMLFSAATRARIMQSLDGRKNSALLSDGLTPQENRVLQLIGDGLTNREIGQSLHLAEKTVKNYVSSLLAKLGFQRRTQAAIYVARSAESKDQAHPFSPMA